MIYADHNFHYWLVTIKWRQQSAAHNMKWEEWLVKLLDFNLVSKVQTLL